MRITITNEKGTYTTTSNLISLTDAGVLKSTRAHAIIEQLLTGPATPRELARELAVHEQGVYYHLRRLERAGIIRIESAEKKRGAIAHRYELSADAYTILLKEPERTSSTRSDEGLEPFIENGEMNARIIVGSPDPHGPQQARSRDGYYGMDLALFLGTHLSTPRASVILDTETRREDLEDNLIIIGGPIVNAVAESVNEASPIRFDTQRKRIVSTISNQEYLEEGTGVISTFTNPHNPTKKILWVYGLRNSGTRAAIIAFTNRYDELKSGNRIDASPSRVVLGRDLDSDGIIDAVSFAE